MKKPVILCILDGWGYSKEEEYNAIARAYKPTWDYICNNYPNGLLSCSGKDVGLPEGQVGNSEVGHLHLGAGEVILQDLEFINQNIKNVSKNNVFKLISEKISAEKNIHLIGLCSDGGVHSHIDHIIEFYKIFSEFKKNNEIFLHFISDGRDTLPFFSESMIDKLIQNNVQNIATLIGRYYAMDRNNDYDKTNLAFSAIYGQYNSAFGKYTSINNLKTLIKNQYKNNLSDEFLFPMINEKYKGIKKDDLVLFCNFRVDRSLQLANLFVKNDIKCYSITDYNIPKIKYIFPKRIAENPIGKWISDRGLKQLRIAESEKFPHVTYFFNGNRYDKFPGEDRICVLSKNNSNEKSVFNYNKYPEMSANDITEILINEHKKYDFILVNYANPDMVGHTGDFQATVKGIEELDKCLAKIINLDCPMIITSDHGNAELMYDRKTCQVNTKHTSNKVPIILINMGISDLSEVGSFCYNEKLPSLGNLTIIKKLVINKLS